MSNPKYLRMKSDGYVYAFHPALVEIVDEKGESLFEPSNLDGTPYVEAQQPAQVAVDTPPAAPVEAKPKSKTVTKAKKEVVATEEATPVGPTTDDTAAENLLDDVGV